MILATTKVEDYERFLAIFSTKGAEKRRQHGSKGATVFRDPSEDNRVWALFKGFTFQLEPVIDVMDAVAVELLAMEWRETVA